MTERLMVDIYLREKWTGLLLYVEENGQRYFACTSQEEWDYSYNSVVTSSSPEVLERCLSNTSHGPHYILVISHIKWYITGGIIYMGRKGEEGKDRREEGREGEKEEEGEKREQEKGRENKECRKCRKNGEVVVMEREGEGRERGKNGEI